MADPDDTGRKPWAWHPGLPLEPAPVVVWPPRPLTTLRWLASYYFAGSVLALFGLTATVTWFFLQPALARCATFDAGWIVQMLARNLGLMLVFAGGLHLYLVTFRAQGTRYKFDARDQARGNRRFFAGNQVWDNMLWTCASGVPLWTCYEVLFMHAYANHTLPVVDMASNPLWFALLFVLIPFWNSVHFYAVHRLLHCKPLYNFAHALHHRNINVGPWSGLSMHPVEHLLYLSSVLVHLVIPSHPLHLLFHMHFLTLGAVTSHTGFADLLVGDRRVLALGAFHHQLHHRYFYCNYGNTFVPCDRWFGSDHDGTTEAMARLRRREA